MVLQRACAFVAYTTREAAERAAEELSNKLSNNQRVRCRTMMLLGKELCFTQVCFQGQSYLSSRATTSLFRRELRTTLSHPFNYFNTPAPPQAARTFYPSMDPQRLGAVIPSQEGGDNKSGSEKQPEQQLPNHQGHNYPMAPSHSQGQFPSYITHHMGTWRRYHLTSNSSMPLTHQ